jgi:AcrR family transcriptional regulator
MTRPTTSTRGGQRQAILASAAQLFATHGYHGTSMNDLADACELSKATLYHYFRDKSEVLGNIADAHVSRLVDLCESVLDDVNVDAANRLAALITKLLGEYSAAQNSHRVLTEDVRFLPIGERRRILDKERFVVQTFADAIAAVRPDLARSALVKPVAMLLLGMLNWMFTWLRPNGPLTHESLAPLVTGLFFEGLIGMTVPAAIDEQGSLPRRGAVRRTRASRPKL